MEVERVLRRRDSAIAEVQDSRAEGATVIILDTDVCVELLRGNERVRLARRRSTDEVATTWVTACELFCGAARSAFPEPNKILVEEFLGTLDVFGTDREAARIFGRLKAALEREGRKLADADLMIASLTLSLGATLATGNLKHFSRIGGLELVDWT